MAILKPCQHRVISDRSRFFFCRHPRVLGRAGGVISPAMCDGCRFCDTPCLKPRPVPDDLEEMFERLRLAAGAPRPATKVNAPAATSAPRSNFPSAGRQAWNLASSLATFVADGMATVTAPQYQARLAICDDCEERDGGRCRKCGCHLALKARGRAFECPLDRWPPVETSATERSSARS